MDVFVNFVSLQNGIGDLKRKKGDDHKSHFNKE